MYNREKGYFYEERAMEIFKEKGYEILEKNYYTKVGEIDFISMKDEMLVFVEVKYRKNSNYGFAEESVTQAKLKRIINASLNYISEVNWNEGCRYDLVAINGEEIIWVKNLV